MGYTRDMTRSIKNKDKTEHTKDGGIVRTYKVDRIEIKVTEMPDHKKAALYLVSGNRRFTLEYELDAGMGEGFFPLVISEVLKEKS